MAFEKVVQTVHAQFLEEKQDAIRNRVDPRTIRILDSLILLTADEDEAQDLLDGKLASMPVPKCKHEHIDPANGKCKDCNTPIFSSRLPGV